MSHPRSYAAEDIDVQYDVRRCIHAAECVHGAPSVFDPNRKPWVDPTQGDSDLIAEVVTRCPTGALHFTRKDGGAEEVPEETNTVLIQPDGPLHVRGDIRVETAEGEILLTDTRVALCRCGLSKNKPFCDNAHLENFKDAAALGAVNVIEASGETSSLTILAATDGPLLLNGPVSISSAESEEITTEKCALCRCGHSSNKPFCDGTHKDIGFESSTA